MWGDKPIPQQDSYRLLGVLLHASGTWAEHLADLLQRVTSRVNHLKKFLRSPDLAVPVKLMLVKTCLLPAFEYGTGVWHATRRQSDLLRTQYLKALKMVLQCPVSTPTEAVMGDLGMPSLQHRWDLDKLRFEFKLQHMPAARDPQAVLDQIGPLVGERGTCCTTSSSTFGNNCSQLRQCAVLSRLP